MVLFLSGCEGQLCITFAASNATAVITASAITMAMAFHANAFLVQS